MLITSNIILVHFSAIRSLMKDSTDFERPKFPFCSYSAKTISWWKKKSSMKWQQFSERTMTASMFSTSTACCRNQVRFGAKQSTFQSELFCKSNYLNNFSPFLRSLQALTVSQRWLYFKPAVITLSANTKRKLAMHASNCCRSPSNLNRLDSLICNACYLFIDGQLKQSSIFHD